MGVFAAAMAPACGGEAVIDPPLGSGGASTTSSSGNTSGTSGTQSSTSSGMMCTETGSTGSGVFHYSHCINTANCPDAAQAIGIISQTFNEDCCVDPDFVCEELRGVTCGPFATSEGTCCYEIDTEEIPCAIPGRPLTIDGNIAQAPAVKRLDWKRDTTPNLDGLSSEARAELAARWLSEAQLEHASVASFSRFALELMALGAPPALIEAAHAAAIDEVRHAELAFALASVYAGEPMGPGPLALPSHLPLTIDLVGLAVATFREACVNETVAAVLAAERRDRATDPAVRSTLGTVAEDESRHAELGWRFLAWALRQSDDVAIAIAAEAEQLHGAAPALGDAPLAAHGQLDAATEAHITRLAIDEVVRPAVTSALGLCPKSAART